MSKVLFLCTGNYYRSRLAEEYFNHLAKQYDALAGFSAYSKGLMNEQEMDDNENVGPIASQTVEVLEALNVPPVGHERMPESVKIPDFEEHCIVMAMDEIEHYPMMQQRFPEFADKILYLDARDKQFEPIHVAVVKLIKSIETFTAELAEKHT